MAIPTAKTQTQLAQQALRNIRVLRPDEQASAENDALCDTAYESLYAELGHHGLAFWPVAEIPVSVFWPLAMLVAAQIAPNFNKPYDAGDAMQRIRAVAGKPWDGSPVRSQHF